MPEKCFKVGLIGYGRSGRNIHARTINEFPGHFTVAAVSDVTENRRQQASAEYDCPVYADYRDMAQQNDIDLFINTAFSSLHVPISIELLRQKKAVLCEKPLTGSMEEFERLETAVCESRAFFTVFHNLRYDPVYVKMSEWLASGIIGEPIQISMTSNQLTRRWDWATLKSNGGGVLLMSGVHTLDMALHLAGTSYEPSIASILKHRGIGDADNYAKVLLTSANGPTIDIECSSFDAFPGPRYHVQGTCGTIVCHDKRIEAAYYNPADANTLTIDTEPLLNEEGNPVYCREQLPLQTRAWEHTQDLHRVSFRAYYEHLYNALTGKEDVPVTMDELRQQVRILDTCFKYPVC